MVVLLALDAEPLNRGKSRQAAGSLLLIAPGCYDVGDDATTEASSAPLGVTDPDA
jgi:hypothetical protein